MRKLLERYIAKTVVTSTLMVLLVVTVLSFTIALLAELHEVGTGDYHFKDALMYVLLLLPHYVYQFFPMLMMLGGILGLSVLAQHHELIAMRTLGFSMNRMIVGVLGAAVALMIVSIVIGEGIAPEASLLANKQKSSALNRGQAVATASGVWIHEGNNFLHIDQVLGEHFLVGVTRYEFDAQHHLLASYFVKSMRYEQSRWQLEGLVKTLFLPEQTKSESLNTSQWDLTLNPNLLSIGVMEPQEMSLSRLLRYSHHLADNGVRKSEFAFEFWKRLFQPITTLVMILLAVPFVFAAPRSVTLGLRILLGTLVGFVFYIVNAFLGQVSVVYQVSPLLAAILPTLLIGSVGVGWMVRKRE